jgi:hypothetical protein
MTGVWLPYEHHTLRVYYQVVTVVTTAKKTAKTIRTSFIKAKAQGQAHDDYHLRREKRCGKWRRHLLRNQVRFRRIEDNCLLAVVWNH